MQKFGYKSTMVIPCLEKIVLNVGCSEARERQGAGCRGVRPDRHHRPEGRGHQGQEVRGQLKLREGMPIGAKVTLRGNKMWEFLDRLFNVALPRVRDFRGISADSFDGRGNYALGVKGAADLPRD